MKGLIEAGQRDGLSIQNDAFPVFHSGDIPDLDAEHSFDADGGNDKQLSAGFHEGSAERGQA